MGLRDYVAARVELLGAGFAPTQVDSWLRTGRLVRLFHGIYSYGRDVDTQASVLRAALLVGGTGSALTGRSGLQLWGAVKPRHALPRAIEVATVADRGGRHAGLSPALHMVKVIVLRRTITPGDVKLMIGFRVLRPALALIDFAVDAPAKEVRSAFLELCRLRRFRREDVDLCFRRVTGRRGAGKIKPLLALWTPGLNRIRSVFEGLYLLAWTERGLEMPKVNSRVFGLEVDLYWPRHRFVLELDGGAFHGDELSRARDREKNRFLESRGLEVMRVSWSQFDDDPERILNLVAERLAERATLGNCG